MNSIIKNFSFLLAFCLLSGSFAQAQGFKIREVDYGDSYSFPLLVGESLAEERINDFLWADWLNILPERFKHNAFEKAGLPDSGSNQGVTEIDYDIIRNDAKLFIIHIHTEYTGAGLNEYNSTLDFDTQTGNLLNIGTLLTPKGYLEVREKIISNRKKRLRNYLQSLDTTANGNTDPDTYDVYNSCLQSMDDEDVMNDAMVISRDTVTLTMPSCGDTHYFQATDTADVYQNRLTEQNLKPYLNEYGRCLLSEGKSPCIFHKRTDGMIGVYKGTINDRYPVTFIISGYDENTIQGVYFYDKYGIKIPLSGQTFDNNKRFTFHEQDEEGNNMKGVFHLNPNGDGGFSGTWSDGKNTFPVVLK